MLLGRDKLKRIPWALLFVEAAVVVLSVLLAFGVRNWRQNEKNEKLAQLALQNLVQEIRYNKRGIKRALPKHVSRLDTLLSKNPPPIGLYFYRAYVQNSAWKTAQNIGAVPYMNFAIVREASEIYRFQKRYNDLTQSINETLNRVRFRVEKGDTTKLNLYKGTISILRDLIRLEKELLKTYNSALQIINKKNQELSDI